MPRAESLVKGSALLSVLAALGVSISLLALSAFIAQVEAHSKLQRRDARKCLGEVERELRQARGRRKRDLDGSWRDHRRFPSFRLPREDSRCMCDAESSCPAGPMGPPGTPGLDAPPGQAGRPGSDGLPGVSFPVHTESGDLGRCSLCPPGPSGPPGSAGASGGEGAKGQRGPAGPRGAFGLQGPPGLDGAAGSPGSHATPGSVGPPGRPGVRGAKGFTGRPGESGQPGPRGPPGEDGWPGGVGDEGGLGPTGELGDGGQPGREGEGGRPGSPGPPGEDRAYCHCPKRQRPRVSTTVLRSSYTLAKLPRVPQLKEAETAGSGVDLEKALATPWEQLRPKAKYFLNKNRKSLHQ